MAERTNPHANLIIGAQDEASPVFDKIKASSQSMAAGVEQAAAKAGKATDGMGDGAEKGAEKFTRAESLMRAAIMKSTRELELLGKTASQRFEAQIDFKGLEKAKFQEAISGLQAMESALSVAKAREAEFAAQNGFSLKAAQAKELVKASEYARWWAQELEKVEAAEKRLAGQNSFINSLKSQADAIGKTKADLLEMQAAQMGVATQAAPFIAKMREADAGIGKMGISAAQTAAALRGVPAQFTDIVTSLQGGQSAMQVFLQQGGQLKDMFGGAGNAARALGGYVLGLVNPFTVAAAAVAGIAVAYNQGAKEADAYRAALVTTGNAAGTTATQLKSYAQEISGVVGTQGKAAESLAAMAATGKIGAESLREAAQAAVAYERATGQAASKTAEQFASLRGDPLSAVLKLNDSMNFLTESTYKQIKSLEEQGKTAEAANVAQRAFADTLSGRAGEMERNLGTVERGWLAVKDAAKSAWDAILNVGRASTSVDQLAEVRKQIAQRENQIANGGFGTNEGGAAFGRPSQAATERLRAELAGLQAKAAALEGVSYATRVSAEEERKRGEAVKAGAAFDKAGEKFLSDKTRMERELAAARVQGAEAGRSQEEIEKRLGEIRASYAKKGGGGVAAENKELRDQQRIFAELAGVSSTYYAELANAQKQRAAGVITEQQYVTAVQSLIEKQPFAVALAKEEAEAAKVLAKAYQEAAAERIKTIQSMERAADSLQSQNDALREEIELIGLSTEQQTLVLQQRNDVIILTKEATLAELERQSAITGTQTRVEIALASEIDALKERNALLGAKGVKNAAVDAAKSAADEWQKTSDKINDTLTDALMRGFESGKDFAKNLRDTVVNMFKTMVLRPVISAVVNPIAGSVTSALGLSGAQGGGNSFTSGLQTASNLNSLYGAGSQALFGGAAGASAASLGYANAIGMAGGDAIGALATANGMWAGVATGAQAAAQSAIAANVAMAAGEGVALAAGTNAAAAGAGAAGAAGSSLGSMAAAAGPWVAAAAAIYAIASSLDDSGTYHTGGAAQYSAATGLRTSLGFRDNEEGLPSYNPSDNIDNQFGTGFGYVERGDQTISAVSGIAQGLSATLDGVAVAFGEKAGYAVATAFADDTSKDGAWGALRISKDGQELLNWEDTRQSKWAPREFSDGEEGYNQYLAAVAKDTRQVLLDMDLPSWADTMLESIGDAANMDQLAATVQQIGVIQTTFVQLGKTMEGFAGLTDKAFEALMRASGGFESLAANAGTYYENFYSEAEKTAAVTRSVSDALAQVGLAMPATRDEFRALVESQLALGESGAEAVAALLGVSGAFASVTASAVDVSEAARQLAEEQARAAKAAQDAAYSDFRRAVDRDRSVLQDQASMLADAIGSIADAVSMLKSNARELYGTVDSTAQMLAAQGMVYIENALAGVRAGGSVADYTGLSDAIGAARGGIDSGTYATQFERDRDALVLAGQLSELGTLGDAQLSIEERQLRAINEQLEYLDDLSKRAEAMVSGTAALTGTVQSYFDKLLAFLAPSKGENNADGAVTVGGAPPGQLAPPAEFYREQVNALGGAWGKVPVRDAADVQRLREVKRLYDAAPTAGYADLGEYFSDMRDRGYTMFDIGAATGHLYKDIKAAAAGFGIPAFAVGTNYVPRDMLAQIHEGEAIIPKAYNPAANTGMGGGNSEVVSELRALREENRQQAGEIARLNLRMARVLEKFDGDGMPATRDEAVV